MVEGVCQGLKISIYLFNDGLLSKFLLDEYLLQFLYLVVSVDGREVLEFVNELSGMDVKVLPATLLADDSLGAFGVAAHEFAYLFVDLALGVYQFSGHQ